MSFTAKITWYKSEMSAGEFNRDHSISFGSGQTIQASSAPEYKGNAERVNPEESLLSALSSCHMLTFLAIAHLKRLPVAHYEDNAHATLGRLESGKLAVTEITLNPKVIFDDVEVTDEILQKIHNKAHDNCFIANSISTNVIIVPKK
ncbi:MAG: OsmC family protein [Parashewanella sp.]